MSLNTLKNKGISVGDFAASILEADIKDIKAGKKTLDDNILPSPVAAKEPPALDVRKIKLEDEEYNRIFERSFNIKVETKKPTKERKVISESHQEVKSPDAYIKQLIKLINEAKQLINEMTTCGMIGTNQGPPPEDPMKIKLRKKLKARIKKKI